ncbi:MAG: hypothetical protein HQL90_04635 [Magnetococcales bacterium]|nr:hypothetical protein [Magnetococcales bacterium]
MNGESDTAKSPWDEQEDLWEVGETEVSPDGPPLSNRSGFENWLHIGLKGYLLEGWGVKAFPGIEAILERRESLIAGLKELYDRQDPQRQSDFRLAVSDLLASPSLEERPANIPLFQKLLQLAARLPAPEVLPVLTFRIRRGFWERWTTEEGESLFTEAMLAVSQLAAPRPDAVECLNSLMDSLSFDRPPYTHTATALLALCQIQPNAMVAHLTRLRPRLVYQFNHYQVGPGAQRQLAVSLLASVGPQQFLEGLIILKGQGDQRESYGRDDWLMRAVFSELDGHPPLLACREVMNHQREDLIFCLSGRSESVINPRIMDIPGWTRLRALLYDHGWVSRPELSEQEHAEVYPFFGKAA